MLVISKNKSKSSQAVVKFTRTKPAPKPVPRLVPLPMPLPPPPPMPLNFGSGVQKHLTEADFLRYLVGFVQISPMNLPAAIGKRIRYAIDTVDKTGRVISTQFRLGGIVKAISGDNVMMFNPGAGATWTLKISQPPNKRLRLYLKIR